MSGRAACRRGRERIGGRTSFEHCRQVGDRIVVQGIRGGAETVWTSSDGQEFSRVSTLGRGRLVAQASVEAGVLAVLAIVPATALALGLYQVLAGAVGWVILGYFGETMAPVQAAVAGMN